MEAGYRSLEYVIAQLRHAYVHLKHGIVGRQDTFAEGLIAPQVVKLEELDAILKDPNAVHVNMLRGIIAKPSVEQVLHLYGASAFLEHLNPQNMVEVEYTNYKGDKSIRHITPLGVQWGTSEYHTTPQWLLPCYDHDRKVMRVFALDEIHSWNGEPTFAPRKMTSLFASLTEEQKQKVLSYDGPENFADLGY